jgi:hypothetical protein
MRDACGQMLAAVCMGFLAVVSRARACGIFLRESVSKVAAAAALQQLLLL